VRISENPYADNDADCHRPSYPPKECHGDVVDRAIHYKFNGHEVWVDEPHNHELCGRGICRPVSPRLGMIIDSLTVMPKQTTRNGADNILNLDP